MELGQWATGRIATAAGRRSVAQRFGAAPLPGRGIVASRRGRRGLAQIEEAVKLDPTDASLVVRAGEMSLAVGASERPSPAPSRQFGSTRSWRRPGHCAAACSGNGRARPGAGRPAAGVAIRARQSRDLLQDVAVLYRQRGQPARALATLHHLLDTYPPGEEPQLSLLLEGLTLVDLGRPARRPKAWRTRFAAARPTPRSCINWPRPKPPRAIRLPPRPRPSRPWPSTPPTSPAGSLLVQLAAMHRSG